MAANTTAIKRFFTSPLKKVDMLAIVADAFAEKDDEIMEINKQQLDRGLDADGKSLGRYKNFRYKNRFQPVDLLLTGDFRDKFTLAAGKKKAEIFSQDWKNDMLEKKYGEDIFGISKDFQFNVAEIIKPVIGEKFKQAIGL